MKVKIIQCSEDQSELFDLSYWYRNKIGEILDVYTTIYTHFYNKIGKYVDVYKVKNTDLFILIEDVISTRQLKLERILNDKIIDGVKTKKN